MRWHEEDLTDAHWGNAFGPDQRFFDSDASNG
jgi:hypothetical protein